jgi:small GTP-binding protein
MNLSQEIKRLEEEIKRTPYNKATEHHIGRLKAKLAKLKEELEKQRQKKSKGVVFSLKKEGDASVFLVGFPSVGKSTLLNALTGAKSEVADYDFTTLKPVPGMLDYKGAKIQIVDVPGLIEGASKGRGRGREVLSFIRNADLIVIVTDVFTLHQIDVIKRELYESGIRLDCKPPEVILKKRDRGGIKITSTVPLSIDEKTIVEILKENKIHNAEITIREDLTIDRLIDAILGNRVYIPSITVVNKFDLYQPNLPDGVIPISAEKSFNLDVLKEEIYRKLEFIRIYLKPPGGKADFEEPLIMRKGCTIADVCRKLHRGMVEDFRYAKVWGRSVKYQGQRVGLDHVLEDEDIVTIYA